jgi:flavin reductase (DIM6/NTAB) family NADH-FMN oxidoreductase RutF
MMKMLTIDPKETPIPQLHQFLIGSIGPRPICFASTIDKDGKPNLAPFSFFNIFSANPPIVIFAPNNSGRDGTPKHTYLNVKEVPEVVINVVTLEMVEKMNVAAAPWEQGVNEFEKAGFSPLASELIKPFRVAESPVQLECKVLEVKEMGTGGGAGNLVICQVIKVHINEDVLGEDGKISQLKMNLVGRLGGSWYCKTDENSLFELAQPMQKTIGYDALPEEIKLSKVLSDNDIGKLATQPTIPTTEEIDNALEQFGLGDKHETAKKLIIDGQIRAALALFCKN